MCWCITYSLRGRQVIGYHYLHACLFFSPPTCSLNRRRRRNKSEGAVHSEVDRAEHHSSSFEIDSEMDFPTLGSSCESKVGQNQMVQGQGLRNKRRFDNSTVMIINRGGLDIQICISFTFSILINIHICIYLYRYLIIRHYMLAENRKERERSQGCYNFLLANWDIIYLPGIYIIILQYIVLLQ